MTTQPGAVRGFPCVSGDQAADVTRVCASLQTSRTQMWVRGWPYGSDLTPLIGVSGDVPVRVGGGCGSTIAPATWRPGNGVWYFTSLAPYGNPIQLGARGDVPV